MAISGNDSTTAEGADDQVVIRMLEFVIQPLLNVEMADPLERGPCSHLSDGPGFANANQDGFMRQVRT